MSKRLKKRLKSLKVKAVAVLLALLAAAGAVFLWLAVERGDYIKYEAQVSAAAEKFGVDKSLVYAVIRTESNFNEMAKSKKGALGLMQIMPSTAAFVAEMLNLNGYDLFDASDNITVGVGYLAYLSGKFKFEEAVLAAYNAGEANAKKWLDRGGESFSRGVPFKETREYIKKVKRRKRLYKYV